MPRSSGVGYERRSLFATRAHGSHGGIHLTTRTSTIVLTIVTTLALALVPAASAWNHDELPTLASGGGPGIGWASFKVDTDGSLLAFELNANDIRGSAQAGGYVFDGSGNLVFGFTFTAVGFPTDGTLIDVTTPATGNLVHMDTRAPSAGGGGMGIGLSFNEPGSTPTVGTMKVLLWAAGNAASWDYHVRGTTTAVLGSLSGSHAFLYGADDFSGTAYAQHYANGIGGRAAANTHKIVDVQNTFFGVFYDANFKIACAAVACAGAPAGTSVLTGTAPGATTPTNCFCSYSGSGPGTYDFAMSGVDASATSVAVFQCSALGACVVALPWQDSIILGGVDAALPQ